MPLPISFDDVSYFKNEFRGDLIITPGVLYYFPHTNVALERKENRHSVARHFGLLGLAVEALIAGVKELRKTMNQPRIEEIGLWKLGEDYKALQARLDAFIEQEKKKPTEIVEFEYKLPKPMRFAQSEVRNLRLNWSLTFDTQYDNHDFAIGVKRKSKAREALWEAGLLR